MTFKFGNKYKLCHCCIHTPAADVDTIHEVGITHVALSDPK